MATISSARRTDGEVTSGQSSVGLPLMGEARRTDHPLTDIQLSDGDWILAIVKKAQETTVKQAAAIRIMGIAKTQYIENLQGTGHLSIRRLGLMPQEFWEEVADGIRAHFGMDNDEEKLNRALECVERGLRQVGEIARKRIK